MKKNIVIRPCYFAFLYFLICLIFIIEAFSASGLNYIFDFVDYGGTFKYHDLKILGIPAYWFMMISGLFASVCVSFDKRKKYVLNKTEALIFPLAFLIVSFIGGKLLYILENYKTISEHGIEFNGLSLFGAIFIVPIAVFIATRFTDTEFKVLLDLCTLFGLILLACVRTGCFINGCCGASTIWYDTKPIILPIQLIEVIFDLMIIELCLHVEKKAFNSGLMYPVFMIGYGAVRFVLEFFRKSDKVFLIFSNGQICAIICVIAGVLLFGFMHSKAKKNAALQKK